LRNTYLSILLIIFGAAYVINPGAARSEDKIGADAATTEKAQADDDGKTGVIADREEPPAADVEKAEGGEKPYHVEADVTEGYYTAGKQVLHGIGNVVIVHAGTTITCDEAYSYEAEKLATLLGNVKVKNKIKRYTLTSGYAEYRRD
jgi:lipopolysaccharide assembly outer membrane protein LptD (OstA)